MNWIHLFVLRRFSTTCMTAAGIPLLIYFCGSGNLDARSLFNSVHQSQIVEMIKAFEATNIEPHVIYMFLSLR